MRGFPPIHLLLLMIAFGLIAVPLSHLTFARPTTVATWISGELPEDTQEPVKTFVRLRFAHLPMTLEVKQGNQVLMSEKTTSPSLEMEITTKMVVPKEGLELLVNATWPENTPSTAVAVEVEPDGKSLRSQTLWSVDSTLGDVCSLTW